MSGETIITNIGVDYPEYMRDESRLTGVADSISFPTSEEHLQSTMDEVRDLGKTITLQGARTGITGGAVPDGGHVISLVKMNKIMGLRSDGDGCFLCVQPGVLLSEIREYLENNRCDGAKYFFAPDPTETSASIGGMVACNASGARSFHYGSTRKHIERLRMVLADGDILDISRGMYKANKRSFRLVTESGRAIEGVLPEYNMPAVKNAAGYYVADDMDMLDLFVGSEGTLGILTEIELDLTLEKPVVWGLVLFLPDEQNAIEFVQEVRSLDNAKLCVMEYFDYESLALLRHQKETNSAFEHLPIIPTKRQVAVYLEYHGDNEGDVEDAVMQMSEIMLQYGGDEDATWLATDLVEMTRLKEFRHAIPEAVNLTIDQRRKTEPSITKLGTDLAVPDDRLEDVIKMYRTALTDEGLESVIFGHIGNNHLHVNIIPNTPTEYEQGKKLYLSWAEEVVKMGGTVSAEHGIGKLKKKMLEVLYSKRGVNQMQDLKGLFDPDTFFNKGTLF